MNRPFPENVTTYTLEEAFLKGNLRFPSANKMNEYCRGEWFPHDENCFGYSYEVEVALTDSVESCVLSMGVAKYDTTLSERGWCVVGECELPESSSSSVFEICQEHPFENVPNNPEIDCFTANGECYKCNPDRGSDCYNDWLWIYDFNSANVGWWYKEVDCETGLAKEEPEEFLGQCPLHPLKNVPSNPENACFAANGKCYKCNSDRGGDCYNDWLWIYDFNSANVGWWYEEVDCDEPFEEDFDGQFPDEIVLMKRTANFENEERKNENTYSIDLLNAPKYFDALGRSQKKVNECIKLHLCKTEQKHIFPQPFL